MSSVFNPAMQRILRDRARQLMHEGQGHRITIERLTLELLDAARGRSNRLTELGIPKDWTRLRHVSQKPGVGRTMDVTPGLAGSSAGPDGIARGATIASAVGALAATDRKDRKHEAVMQRAHGEVTPQINIVVCQVYENP